jgi:hypothetical protein
MTKECPNCGRHMEYVKAEPDVGITRPGWFCVRCTEWFDLEDGDE